MAGRKAAGTPATVALAKAGVHYVVHEYEHDPANTHFGDESVAALGVDATRVFKTLVVHLVGGREATVCVLVPVAWKCITPNYRSLLNIPHFRRHNLRRSIRQLKA